LASSACYRVDKGADTAALLRLGDTFERERGLARRVGAVDFDYAPARQSAHSERKVKPERAGRDHQGYLDRLLAELHYHRALTELFLDLAERQVECLCLYILSH
jgi:hypothetical protein